MQQPVEGKERERGKEKRADWERKQETRRGGYKRGREGRGRERGDERRK